MAGTEHQTDLCQVPPCNRTHTAAAAMQRRSGFVVGGRHTHHENRRQENTHNENRKNKNRARKAVKANSSGTAELC